MRRSTGRPRSLAATILCCALALPAAGCVPAGGSRLPAAPAGGEVPVLTGGANPTADPAFAVAGPGPLRGATRSADLIVVGQATLPGAVRRRVEATSGVADTVTLGLATVPVRGRMVTVGSVDPASYRRFTPPVTARTTAVWQRVAEGDVALSPALAADLEQPLGGDLALGNQAGALVVRVGAEATMAAKLDAVVNHVRGRQLGMSPANAVIVSTAGSEPAEVAEALRRRVGDRATVTLLGALPVAGQQTAFLSGGSVAAAVGSFHYRYFADGTVTPDPVWVAASIRTESVPLLGAVTCHRVMLPQLRGALEEVVARGLAASIDTGDYGGCYVPRFIARDPSQGLSLHTWGIAVDLNVQGNLRGTPGQIDRRVVEVFRRWGFAWGGDWSYTDPMHFELAALVRPPG